MRKMFILAFGALLSVAIHAQVTVSGNNIQSVFGGPLYAGQWCFGSQCMAVSQGSFSGSVTAGTQTVTVLDGSNATILTLSSLTISGASFNWNLYTVPYGVSYTGNGQPYLPCQSSAEYVQGDSTPTGAIWYCVAQSGQLTWKLSGPPTPSGPGLISGLGIPTMPAVVPTIYVQTDTPQQYSVQGATGTISTSWAPISGSGATPALPASSIQFACNPATALCGSSNFTYNSSTGQVTIGAASTYNAIFGPLETMTASWYLDTNSPYYMKASLGIPVFSILDYGAVADGVTDLTGSMTSGSPILTITDGKFTNTLDGKRVTVQTAGPGSTQLSTTFATGGYIDANHYTLSTAASSTTISGVPDPVNGLTLSNAGSYGYVDGSFVTTTSGSGSGLRVSIYSNGGLNSVSAVTGGTISGTGTCTVTGFNNGLSGATVTATYTSGSFTSAVVSTAGYGTYAGYTSFVGTISGSGTGGQATCSGSATVTGTAGTISQGTPMVSLGSGYANGDTACPTVPSGDGTGCFTINQVDGAGVIWGTDNYTALSAANAALQAAGGGRLLIPQSGTGVYVVNTALGANTITLASNEIIDQDTSTTLYWIGAQSAAHAFSFFYVVPSNVSNVHFWHNNCQGEWIIPEPESGESGGPFENNSACIVFSGNGYYNVTIDGGRFGSSFGHGISGSGNGSPLAPVVVHDVAFENTVDTGINLNTAYGIFRNNSFSFSEGVEIGGDACRIEGNNFYAPNAINTLSVGGVTSFAVTHGCYVAGNKIFNPSVNEAISLADGSGNSTVIGNTITGLTGSEEGILSIFSGYANNSPALIQGNVISGSGTSTVGIYLGPTYGTMLRGNTTIGLRNGAEIVYGTADSEGNTWGTQAGGVGLQSNHGAVTRTHDYFPAGGYAANTGGSFTADSVFDAPLSIAFNGQVYLLGCVYLSNGCGTVGQAITSNGTGAAASWTTPTVNTAFTTAVSAPTFATSQGSSSSTNSPLPSSNGNYAFMTLLGKDGGNSGIYFGTVNASAGGSNQSGSWIGAYYNSNYSSNLAFYVGEVGNITAAPYQSIQAMTIAGESSNTGVFASLNGGMYIGPTASSTDPGVNNLETYGNIYDLGAETSSGSNCLQINAGGLISNTGSACGVVSGTVGAANGGTGISTSSSTGVAQVNAGTWSVSTALANGTTATTQAPGTNNTTVATMAAVQAAVNASVGIVNVPSWLAFLGTGADGAETCNGNLNGDYYYTTFSVPYGDTCTVNGGYGLVIHATGACTIAGTVNASSTAGSFTFGLGGGTGGGSGGGTASGITGGSTTNLFGGTAFTAGGTAGGASGGGGGNGNTPSSSNQRALAESGGGIAGQTLSGGVGHLGGNSGGTAGLAGGGVVFMCASFTGTDGTHTGTITVAGGAGGNSTANNTGAGSGGGGGVILISSQTTITTLPTLTVSGGSGGTCGAFTGCGTGGSGANGWDAVFSGW